jgi:predicted DNA-binding transcriptional regulator YafY
MDSIVAQGVEQVSHHNVAFKYIELLLQWRGKLNTGDLMTRMGISRQSASKAISSYKKLYPNALNYNAREKRYEPTEEFLPEFTSGSFQEYISLIHGELSSSLPTSFLPGTHRPPSPYIVRPIINAIENNLRLDVSYASISSPEFTERIISPHSMIYDGNRWHIRAWCEKNQDYRDFVLTRIKEVFGTEGVSASGLEEDKGWNTWVNLSIEPDPRLNDPRREIIAMDYGMIADDSGQLTRTYRVRGALVIYWLQQLRLDSYSDRAEAQQIVLSDSCLDDAEKWGR